MKRHERKWPLPSLEEVRRSHDDADAESALGRLVAAAEATDRSLMAFLTSSTFLVVLSGAPIATAADKPGLYVPSAFGGLAAFLMTLRGITRRVGARPGLPPDWPAVAYGREGLSTKRALAWVSSRILRWSAIWLVGVTVCFSVA